MVRPNIWPNKAAAIGERTAFWPQANSTASGWSMAALAASGRLALPMQHRDQREQAARGVEIKLDLAAQPLHDDARAFVVQRAPAHVERFDAVRRRGADRRVIAVADREIVLHDAAERRQRQHMGDDRRAVGGADVEHQAIARNAELQCVGALVVAGRLELVLGQQIVDGDRALVLDVAARAPDRGLIERDGGKAIAAFPAWCACHYLLSRMATERAWASSPSAVPSAMAAPPNARNCSGPHLRIEVRFMKSSTPRPEENRAERAVGSTGLETA